MITHPTDPHCVAPHPAVTLVAAALLLTAAMSSAQAGTFGSLANFDVVNDTGRSAYGFEIEIEDTAYDRPGTISSIFGYDRVFGFISPDPGAVVRFGKPTLEYIPGFGARITYGGVLGGTFTPSAPYVTQGESCWPGANANWQATSCDHFGVSTYGSPAKTTYRWIVDIGGGTLARQVVGVPAINIAYVPPPAPDLPPVQPPVIQLQAQDLGRGHDPAEQNQNNAFWVKIIKTELDDKVVLNDLLGGNHVGARPEIAGLDGLEVEVEWQPLQLGRVDEVSKSLDSPKPSVVYKFQFFNYLGRFDDDGYVDPQSGKDPGQENQLPQIDGNGIAFVTIGGQRQELNFIGQQIAGFNAVEVAAVPEPQAWALMLAGLVAVGSLARRRR